MKKVIIIILALTISLGGFAQKAKGNQELQKNTTVITTRYSCPMHQDEVSDKPGKCAKCGMNLSLSLKDRMKSSIMKIYYCPVHSMEVSDMAGKCPVCGMALKEKLIRSAFYSCPKHSGVVSDKPGKCTECGNSLVLSSKEKMKTEVMKIYSCPMHPEVTGSQKGKCPKCGMDMDEKQ